MNSNDGGVSPVVGVMLMLSVTIIIAAIVSGVAGSYSATKQNTPSAILEVHLYENRSYGTFTANAMTIDHISGSPLQTKDLSISTYFRNESGQIIKGFLLGEKARHGNSAWADYDHEKYCGDLFINDLDRFGSPLQNTDSGYKNWFGNASAVLMPGDMLVTPAQFCGPSSPHDNPGLNDILGFDTTASSSGYRAGAVITVKIVHIPTGQIIFDKDVVIV